jgi:hypothetical protein
MKVFTVLLCFASYFVGISSNCPLSCAENEIFTNCTLSQFQSTCWNRHIRFDETSISCSPGCDCRDGFVRDPQTYNISYHTLLVVLYMYMYKCIDKKNCIRTPAVGVCPRNEFWSSCGFRCDKTCDFVENRDLTCRSCIQGCICQNGFVRSTLTGQCIMEKDCDGKKK